MEWFGRFNVEISPTGRNLADLFFVKIDKWSRFASCWARFDAYGSLRYVIRVIWSDVGIWTSKYLQREANYGHVASKSTKYRALQAVGLDRMPKTACTMFWLWNWVIWAFERRHISGGKIITIMFRQNRRRIVFCESLGLFQRVIQRALCSACKM
jgi:hypothetical protein